MSNSWRGAPPWDLDQLELLYYIARQNKAILAKLNDQSTQLSDDDQMALDQLTNILKGTNEKIDGAKKDE